MERFELPLAFFNLKQLNDLQGKRAAIRSPRSRVDEQAVLQPACERAKLIESFG